MRKLTIGILGAAVALAVSGQAAEAQQAQLAPLESQQQKASYGVGFNVGTQFRHDMIELDFEAFARGFKDGLGGTKAALSAAELTEALSKLKAEVGQRTLEQAAKAKKAGEDFLAKNKSEEGVKTTKSGLQYKVVKEGKGDVPKPTDTVQVHYRGTLIDGTQFDSSYDRNEPISFPVNGVIAGWTEALQLMKPGSKMQLFIPTELAYGENSQPPIPPNSALLFDVELLKIEKSEP